MGLDITAYRQLKPVACKKWDACYNEHAYIHGNGADFPGRDDGVSTGCNEHGEEFGFRAGSYSGYSVWRDQLAALAGYPAAAASAESDRYASLYPFTSSAFDGEMEGSPFEELVNFSDCEGTIGPVVAKKLAADFAAFQEKADAHEDDYFRTKYGEWRKAFEMAADGGAVCFH